MLTFARNKLVSVAAKDRDTLSIHAVLDDDIYGLEIDLLVGLTNLEIQSISGKWNRWTTPECPRAVPFLQEMKGEPIDEKIGDKINKVLSRKGCRHFANLLLECCHAATEAARVIRWKNERLARPALSIQSYLEEQKARREEDIPQDLLSEKEDPPPLPHPLSRATPRSEPEIPVKDKRSGGFVIDLHAHSFPASSCSSASVDELIEEARRIGLGGICLTDHNHFWSVDQAEDLRQKHGFPVFRGNEITTNQGDMLVFGLEKNIPGIVTLEELREEVTRAGGFLIAAHPFRGFLTFSTVQLGLTTELAAQRPLFQLVDGVEVLNGKVTDKENGFALSVAELLQLPSTGGSDAHRAEEVGRYATRFFVEVHTEAQLIQALKSKKYVPVAFRSEMIRKTAAL
ncbi:MAG: PHP domain-containing protein [Syntrophobacteraceae bacterium]|nr:PHP domain-containing protein [Syntrophobacteraceae bacterium]